MAKIVPLVSTGQFHRWVTVNRLKHGMSQRKVLKLAGLSHQALNNIAKGDSVTLTTAAHLAHVFGYRLALVPVPLDDTQKKAVSEDDTA